jgi:hypothetical protein
MAYYYKYTPCPGSTGSLFYSNEAPSYPGPYIRFDSGSDILQYGKCFEVSRVTLEVLPTPLVSINWVTIVYSFWNDKCSSCVEQLPCGDCPPGYILIDGECILTEIIPANYTGGLVPVVEGDANTAYTKFGLRLYPDISGLTLPLYGYGYADNPACVITIPYSVTDDNGAGVVVTPLLSSVKSKLWGCDNTIPTCQTGTTISNRGRLMTTGIWSPGYPDNVELSFEFCVNIDTTKQYLIGIAGDNKVKIYVDSVLHVFLDVDGVTPICAQAVTTPFTSWHVFPITLNAGNHIIKLSGLNLGSEASFGAEIYDIDLATFQSTLTTPASGAPNCGNVPADIDPYVIFSTKDYIGESIPDPTDPGVWTCPDGYTLDVCNGIPQCTKVIAIPATPCYNVYSLQPCCGGEPVIIYFVDDSLEEDGVYVYTSSLPYGDLVSPSCYTATSYSYTGVGVPPFPQGQISDFSLVEQGCGNGIEPYTSICDYLCLSCVCRRFLWTGTPAPGTYEITYIDCDNQVQTLDIPTDGITWTDKVCMKSVLNTCPNPSVCWTSETFGDCTLDTVTDTYNCNLCYELIDCAGIEDNIYTLNQQVGQYVDTQQVIQIQGSDTCWTVRETENDCSCAITVSVQFVFSTCETCLNPKGYLLTECTTGVTQYTTTDLSDYTTVIIKTDCGGCWTVTELDIIPPTSQPVSVIAGFVDCEICNSTFYELVDCIGVADPIFTTTDLSDYVDQIVELKYCPNTCWQVNVSTPQEVFGDVIVENSFGIRCSDCLTSILTPKCVTFTNTGNTISIVDYVDLNGSYGEGNRLILSGGETTTKDCYLFWELGNSVTATEYGTCVDGVCPPSTPLVYRSVRPGYNTGTCNPEYYETVQCAFSDVIYKNVLAQRYGIANCCPDDDVKWEVKQALLMLDILVDPDYTCSVGTCSCPTRCDCGFISLNVVYNTCPSATRYLLASCYDPSITEVVSIPNTYNVLGKVIVINNVCYSVVSATNDITTVYWTPGTIYETCSEAGCVIPLPCVRYNCQLSARLSTVIFYLDCDGVEASLVVPGAKVIVVPPICGIAGQTSSTFYAVSDGPVNFTFTETDFLC